MATKSKKRSPKSRVILMPWGTPNEDRKPRTEIMPFEWQEGLELRGTNVDGESWLFAVDLCRCLGLANTTRAVSALDADEQMTFTPSKGHSGTRGGAQSFVLVNESGFWALVLKSRKPAAKEFRKWVTGTVLPAIRKTGHFSVIDEESKIRTLQRKGFTREEAQIRLETRRANSDRHKEILSAGGGAYHCCKWHNAMISGMFGVKDVKEMRKLLGDISGTPLDHMSGVPLAAQFCAREIAARRVRDGNISLQDEHDVARQVSAEIGMASLRQCGRDYTFTVIEHGRRGQILDVSPSQIEYQESKTARNSE